MENIEPHPMDEVDEPQPQVEFADADAEEDELKNVDIDPETGLYTNEEEETQDIPKTRSWRKPWSKKKEETVPVEAEVKPPKAEESLQQECNGFGASLLSFCTFGLVSSGDTVVADYEDSPISPEKIVEDLVETEAQLTAIDEDTAMTNPSFNPREKSIMSVHSVHSETGDDSTVSSMISKIIKERKSKTIVFKFVGVIIFLIMCGLFITGGILFKRNGW